MDSPIRLGNVYDERFGTGFGGGVYDIGGIAPGLTTMQGGGREPMVVVPIFNNDTQEDEND